MHIKKNYLYRLSFYFLTILLMKNSLLWLIFLAFFMFFLAWCSMMPDDEEIVRWSVLENEIFWDELNNEELIINNE